MHTHELNLNFKKKLLENKQYNFWVTLNDTQILIIYFIIYAYSLSTTSTLY